MKTAIDIFEAQRYRLQGLAYRMLGAHAEAEDVVQDAWLRWQGVDTDGVGNASAFLAQIVTRLCLDRLGAAAARREQYVGPWLPEPLPEDLDPLAGPAAANEVASDLSFAFLLMLQRLSPAERAAFLLHDVFDVPFAEVAQTLGRSQAACRQLASRARRLVREGRPRYRASRPEGERLLRAFGAAVAEGDLVSLTAMLAEDAEYLSDGGGQVAAPRRAVTGARRIARALVGFAHKHQRRAALAVSPAWTNGLPGYLFRDPAGRVVQTMALDALPDGRILRIFVVRNPAKLRHLNPRGSNTG